MFKVSVFDTVRKTSSIVCISDDWVIVQLSIDRDMDNYTSDYLATLEYHIVYDPDLEAKLAKV